MNNISKAKYLFPVLLIVISLIALCGCRKDSPNGKLDGQWEILSIERGGETITPDQHYICLNLHVVNLTKVGDVAATGNMTYDENEIRFDFPYHTGDKIGQLYPWGIYSNPVTYTVSRLDSKNLVLTSDSETIRCRRF